MVFYEESKFKYIMSSSNSSSLTKNKGRNNCGSPTICSGDDGWLSLGGNLVTDLSSGVNEDVIDPKQTVLGRKTSVTDNILSTGINECDVSRKRALTPVTSDAEEEQDEVFLKTATYCHANKHFLNIIHHYDHTPI